KAFFQILDEVAQDSSVVLIKRKDAPNAAIIAEAELNSLVETVHLLRSPKNAQRLFAALERSQQKDLDSLSTEDTNADQELENLRHYCEQEKEKNIVEVTSNSEGT
ncbi:MAG: type II toxin-antitoxin system Phd/YefM family antitoxin, partial [Cyanobacteria bacterium P01_C01_bin.69]